MLGASAGAGYGYFYAPATETWASPAGLAVLRDDIIPFAVLGGFAAFAYTKLTGWD